jgi:PPOX class probable F420-dependent enzyme
VSEQGPTDRTQIPERVHDILHDKPTGYLATMRPDGRLSVNPVALLFDGEHVRVSTVERRRKVRNLRLDDRCAIAVPHRNNPNRYVEIRGRAEIEPDEGNAFVNAMARHYMGVDEYPFDRPKDHRVVITIHAEQVSVIDVPLADDPPQKPDQPL